MVIRAKLTALSIAALCALVGCPEEKKPAAPDKGKAVTAPPRDPAVADIVFDATAPDDPSRAPRPPSKVPAEVSIRTITVGFGTVGFGGGGRTEAGARRRAALLVKAARKKGAEFVELARRYSDAPAKAREEILRVSPLEEGFAKVGFTIGEGQIADPVRGEDAFHVVQRVEPEEYSSAHILLIFKGTELAPVGLRTTREKARESAEKVLKVTLKDPDHFAVLAGRNSDSPSKTRGGVIAPLQPGKLLKGFEPYLEALKKTKPGEVHPEIVETIYGFHIIKRLPLRKVFVQHIVVSYTGSEGKPRTARDKGTARALAMKLRKEIAGGADFAELAKKHSDDPESAARGGVHQPFAPGEMLPRLEQYAFSLKPGQLSDVFESPHGYHIVKRLR